MLVETKVHKIGNSLGVVLPKEALLTMNAEEGTTLYLTESTEGAIRVTASRPEFSDMMGTAEKGMQKYRNALRELAK